MKKQIAIALAVTGLLIASCKKTQFEEWEYTKGTADFSRYISVGNSLTQGLQDNGLYADGQVSSYPALLAQQMMIVDENAEDFVQPLVIGNGSGYLHLEFINDSLVVIDPSDTTYGQDYQEDPTWATWDQLVQGGEYNNYGISGLKVADAHPADFFEALFQQITMGINPYGRFMDFGGFGSYESYVDNLRDEEHTFFTCWLGSNDVLANASAGADDGFLGFNAMTDPQDFEDKYDSLLRVLTQNGAQGVVMNIPDVNSLPLFTSVKLSDFSYQIWITENDGNTVRVATSSDYILLNAVAQIKQGVGTSQGNPLPHNMVLDAAEASAVLTRTSELNGTIKTVASKYGLSVLDINSELKKFESGIRVDGIDLNVNFIQGGLFSLDAVHLNRRGYAHLTNVLIRHINSEFGSNMPEVDITKYRGITFPNK